MPETTFLQSAHNSTKRNYLERMTAEKPDCMRVAKKFSEQYWDGDRRYGYGGMKYDGRYQPIAETMIKRYDLTTESRILDIGCGKAFLLSDIKSKLKWIKANGCDISSYALKDAPINVRINLRQANVVRLPYPDRYFDFTYSINVFHNLCYKDLKQAIREMVRVTKPNGKSYICIESYRNEEELTNLQAWQLTCLSYYSPDDWLQIYEDCGYKGDYEWIFFT